MKRWVWVAVAVCVFGCECDRGGQSAVRPAPLPLDAAGAPDVPEFEVRVSDIVQVVETRVGDEWREVQSGDRFPRDTVIRTGEGATVTLIMADDTTVVLKQNTELSIEELTAELARVKLARGRIGADVSGKVTLQVAAEGTTAVAETRRGKFSLFSNGRGIVVVASERGSVKLKTSGGDWLLEAGNQAVIRKDDAPIPSAIPEEVLLNVVWPDAKVTRDKKITITGRVAPGTVVRINGTPAVLNPDGTFTSSVALRRGRNPLEVEAVDMLGRKVTLEDSVLVRRTGPTVSSEAEWE